FDRKSARFGPLRQSIGRSDSTLRLRRQSRNAGPPAGVSRRGTTRRGRGAATPELALDGKFHPAVETNLRNAQAVQSRDTQEYLAHIVKRNVLREAILKAMADNRVEALAYPTIRRKANVIGEMQIGTNCQLSANSGLPAIVVPGGFTA